MTLWLLTLAVWPVAAGTVQSDRNATGGAAIAEGKATPQRTLNFRLVNEPDSRSVRGRRPGMVVQTNVMKNGILGVGLFKMGPRKFGDFDSRVDARPSRSRKAAVRFEMKF